MQVNRCPLEGLFSPHSKRATLGRGEDRDGERLPRGTKRQIALELIGPLEVVGMRVKVDLWTGDGPSARSRFDPSKSRA